jgi:hypothetical protein
MCGYRYQTVGGLKRDRIKRFFAMEWPVYLAECLVCKRLPQPTLVKFYGQCTVLRRRRKILLNATW